MDIQKTLSNSPLLQKVLTKTGSLLGKIIVNRYPKTTFTIASIATAAFALVPPINGWLLGTSALLGAAAFLAPNGKKVRDAEKAEAEQQAEDTYKKLQKDNENTIKIKTHDNNIIPITLGKAIDKGNQSSIFRAYVKNAENKQYVCKIESDNPKITEERKIYPDLTKGLHTIGYEANILSNLPAHPNIIHYEGTDDQNTMMLLEKTSELGPNKILSNTDNPAIRKKLLHDMLKAHLHLMENGLCHNDGHSANWLLGYDGELKLIDFGMATKVKEACFIDKESFPDFYATDGLSQAIYIADGIETSDDIVKILKSLKSLSGKTLITKLKQLIENKQIWKDKAPPETMKALLK